MVRRQKRDIKQECIPVECVPTAAVSVTRCHYQGGCLSGRGICREGGLCLDGGLCPEGISVQGFRSTGGLCSQDVSVSLSRGGGSVSGVLFHRGSLYTGSLCPQGSLSTRGLPTPLWTERQTGVKTLLWLAAGNN